MAHREGGRSSASPLADEYLFTVPMWNHGVPYVLKQFIDVVSQPGMAFTFDPEAGLHRAGHGQEGRRHLHGAVFGPGRPPSFARTSRRRTSTAGCAGSASTTSPSVEFRPNLATADADTDRQRAHAEARDAGKRF